MLFALVLVHHNHSLKGDGLWQVVLYGTAMGSIRVLCKPISKGKASSEGGEEADFFPHLEALMRKHGDTLLTRRDHLLYRSYFRPVRGVVDGDLCEGVAGLKPDKLKVVAKALNMKPVDVIRKVEELKTKVMLFP